MRVLINGVFYWLVENCGKGKEILSFKLSEEELEIIDIPDLTQFKDYLPSFKLITKWKESLAFLSIPIHATDLIRWSDVFVKIWTPLFRLPLPILCTVGVVWRNQLLNGEMWYW